MPRSESSTPSSFSQSHHHKKPYEKPIGSRPKYPKRRYFEREEEDDQQIISSDSSSSSSDDCSSEFIPELKVKNERRDMKPVSVELESDLEDDKEDEEDEDHPSSKKKIKSSSTSTPKKVKSESPRKSPYSKAIGRSWMAEEDWVLFTLLHPKIQKPDWNNVAQNIGNARDSKSCQNRYALIQKKLEGAIKSIGGA
ncbi:uncharacterized protein IL334_002026 [Kwoniella shivajii]|uniref:Myb-like domain-containing protein n=1 Tax=Kwoniella shivajii TaxID=564305 RepID=A0ABZ1CUS0_9TREE|nr:hypothetical protein IL334_002026 [Kwoniella shivajii]